MEKRKKERRSPFLCPNCGHEMVCMNKFDLTYDWNNKDLYVWYICPRRRHKGEKGCGHFALLKISPKIKKRPIKKQ